MSPTWRTDELNVSRQNAYRPGSTVARLQEVAAKQTGALALPCCAVKAMMLLTVPFAGPVLARSHHPPGHPADPFSRVGFSGNGRRKSYLSRGRNSKNSIRSMARLRLKSYGENTKDTRQTQAVIGSSGKARGARINKGFGALQSQPQLMAEMGRPAILNRQFVGPGLPLDVLLYKPGEVQVCNLAAHHLIEKCDSN
jgi:hypothetical protein